MTNQSASSDSSNSSSTNSGNSTSSTSATNSASSSSVGAGTAVSLIADNRTIGIPIPSIYPVKGETRLDPITGFSVTRVADFTELTGDYSNHKSAQSLVVYSRFTAVNTTGEYAVIHGDNSTSAWIYRVSDNKMLFPLKFHPGTDLASDFSIGEVNEIRWDYTSNHPYRLYFIGRSLGGTPVKSETIEMSFYYTELKIDSNGVTQLSPILVHDFSKEFPAKNYANSLIMNDVEGDSSIDSRYWAWQVMSSDSWQPYAVLTYDKDQDKVISSIQRSCVNASTTCIAINSPADTAPYIARPNMVEISPLGTRVVVDFDMVAIGYGMDANINTIVDGPKAFKLDFSDPVRIGATSTHSGWAWGTNGEEMFVSQNSRNDYIEAVNIASVQTANCQLIPGKNINDYSCGVKIAKYEQFDEGTWSIGFHFGRIYDRNKRGYAYMNTYDHGTGYAKNQNFLVKIQDISSSNVGSFIRLGSSYNQYFDYRSEGSGALDFSATHIWATGNWGFKDGRGDAFKITLPSNLWQ